MKLRISLIRNWLEKNERTEAYLARNCRVTHAAVTKWLEKGYMPRGESLIRLANVLEMDPRELLEPDNDKGAA